MASGAGSCATSATAQALARLRGQPPMKSASPYDTAASRESRTVTSGGDDAGDPDEAASTPAASSIRMLTPTARSACLVDGHAAAPPTRRYSAR